MKQITQIKTVGEAIQEFYSENNFGDDGGANKRITWMKFGFLSLPMINLDSRNKNVYLHDINHVLTDNDTTWKGESAVSAWEIASGGWGNIYMIWFLALWAMGLGVLIYPKTVLKSFRQGQTMKNAFTSGLSKMELLNLSVCDLKSYVSNKPQNDNTLYFWIPISLIIFLLPFVPLALILILFIIK
ncbi:hypothetical protein [Flavobacterium aestivum]|uniref:hypothetical protein n=1 Tax=Flavobacterium aestivum TaxID=3003257 RepID=UPI0022855D2F|nr:hypothetical protein [Flavobacterium aestivum]